MAFKCHSHSLQNNPYYSPIGTKTIKCIDCGEEIEVDSKDTKTTRCSSCYKKYRKGKVRENVKKYRDKNNVISPILKY